MYLGILLFRDGFWSKINLCIRNNRKFLKWLQKYLMRLVRRPCSYTWAFLSICVPYNFHKKNFTFNETTVKSWHKMKRPVANCCSTNKITSPYANIDVRKKVMSLTGAMRLRNELNKVGFGCVARFQIKISILNISIFVCFQLQLFILFVAC